MSLQTVKLGDIVFQDKIIVSPDSAEALIRPYLGLDQIESQTGKIISYDSISTEGKSIAYAFNGSHVLYGKLRPYLNKVALPEREGRCSTEIIPLLPNEVDREFLGFLLRCADIVAVAMSEKIGSRMPRTDMDVFLDVEVVIPVSIIDQRQIAGKLKAQFAEVENARKALQCQQQEIVNLANALIRASVEQPTVGAGHARDLNPDDAQSRAWPAPTVIETRLGDVLDEIKKGIGETWADYPVLGATRGGLAPAKEPPGKSPQRYKPVTCGTVFYNPMRIMIGSIAFVDDDDEPGITSPDYVALQGKAGLVDSRWFYYWLRSPYGEQCINSLARGAVRERMLFNRLAEGLILLPPYQEQLKTSKALAALKPMKFAIQKQLKDLDKIPERLLAKAFDSLSI